MSLSQEQSREIALSYVVANPERVIFPIKSGAKFPPLIKDNLEQASNDPVQIEKWVKQFSRKGVGPNWGVSCKKSGLLVIDVDIKPGKGGQQTFDDLDLDYGFPETETVSTPSGGFHKYYVGEHRFSIGANGFGTGIDTPNYVVMPGSSFLDGTSYVLTDDRPAAPTEQWFYDVITAAKKERIENAQEAVIELDQPVMIAWAKDFLIKDADPSIAGKGGNITTYRVAASLKDNGISEAKAIEMMDRYYNVPGSCDPEWDYDELVVIIKNAFSYGDRDKAGGKSAEAEFADEDIKASAASIPDDIMGNPAKKKVKETKAKIAAKRADDTPEEKERTWTTEEVCEEWVWCVGIERFIKLKDTNIMWKKTAFESAFCYLAPKKKTYCDSLLSSTGTIRRFHELCYLPGRPRFLDQGARFNCYTIPTVVPAEGDLSWWDAHLEYLFPDPVDRAHVLNWCAWLLQNIALKPKHALLIQGHVQGTGKSFIAEMLRVILHRGNVFSVSQGDLQGQFNGWALRSKLLIVEELRAVERNEVKNKLHDLITQEHISINEKNIPQHQIENCFGILAMTNDDAAITLDPTDRRYLVVRTDAEPREEGYYTTLYSRLGDTASVAAVAHSLMTRDLSNYDARGKAPLTAAKTEMISAGLSDLEQFLLDSRDVAPLSGTVVQVQDVMAMLTKRLETRSSRLHANTLSVLKKRFDAIEAGQFRLTDGSRARLYVINRSALMTFEGWERRIVEKYEAERAAARVGKKLDTTADDDIAADDFDV